MDNIYMEEEREECKIGLCLALGSTHGEYPIPRDHKLHILFPPRPQPIAKEEEEESRGPKRLRSVAGDEEEDSVGRDEKGGGGGGGTRKKLRLTQEQATLLEDTFRVHNTLSSFQKQELAEKLNLKPRQVEVWFQNRRARNKLKQTEVDFEVLKKWCDTLNEENRRLKKELQEMKTLKQQPEGPTLYLDLPKVASGAVSLALCPSCGQTTTTMTSSKKSSSGDSSIAC